ncbi:hypothetical protein G7Z17_g1247 [Cylindrodendrum hubeiense]|uniref:Serine hydrolase domain-containing protein n=1 Tax=Cylindrodendrum hubeiense TaxID=595255 RepID=A0A9P5LKA5_9HYPO|nr:hypothetical protein G7Z17_g1247 [Cylindrodendrum hubeiense]
MTILCLHGAFGSAENFKVQLGRFTETIEKSGSVNFKWIDGGHDAKPPAGFDNYFGQPPLYRFIDFDGIEEMDDMMNKIRDFPEGMSAEDTIRSLVGDKEMYTGPAVRSTLNRIFEILDEDPTIDGILGYSEGAMTAATLILEERRRWEEEGIPRHIKYGIFFAGWPPVRFNGDSVQCLLADECEDIIDVPTCHIVGCNDPYIHGAMALYSMCDEDTAMMFDHGKGHTVPRDARTIQELASVVEGTWEKRATCA